MRSRACSSSGSAWGAPDGAEVLDTSWVPAVEADDLSADSPHDNFWTHDNWPTHNNLPVASYPATAFGTTWLPLSNAKAKAELGWTPIPR